VAHRELMTWNAKQKRWFKKHKKKQFAISCKELGTAPTKEASRRAANQWWENKLTELQANPLLRPRPSTRPIQTTEQAKLAAEIGLVSPAALHTFAESVRRFDAAESQRATLPKSQSKIPSRKFAKGAKTASRKFAKAEQLFRKTWRVGSIWGKGRATRRPSFHLGAENNPYCPPSQQTALSNSSFDGAA
jgi:hypothetical protein